MKLSDYVAEFLAGQGVRHVFLITGGACAHLVDSLGRSPRTGYVCVQHEQAGAMAAEAYARVTGNLGVAMGTSGPGATNLITGICCAWFDSIPTLYLTGQVNRHEQKGKRRIRQLGFQETDIVSIVRPITKYAAQVTDPRRIRYELEHAVHLATTGRPGPVLLDLPLDVQHAEVDPARIARFTPPAVRRRDLRVPVRRALEWLAQAERPVLVAGGGIKLAHAQAEFRRLVDALDIPVVATWSGIDLIAHAHPRYVGQFGVYGARGANFAVQNADLMVSVGSRLDSRQTGGQPQTFARAARKVVVDVDPAELNKRWVTADLPIAADCGDFLRACLHQWGRRPKHPCRDWRDQCAAWRRRYPAVLPAFYRQRGSVNAYVFVEALAKALGGRDTIVADEGGNLTWVMQAFTVKAGQQLFSAFGNSPMGYSLPAAIGAWFANPRRRVICLDGDGGFQINLQELQTVAHYRVPVKIFIFNNRCYGIIKQFQEAYFERRYEATDAAHGYSAPDFCAVAKAYGLRTFSITSHAHLAERIRAVLRTPGPVLCDVRLSPGQKLTPKLIAFRDVRGRYISKPIEDQLPFLPRREFRANMIVPPLD